MTSMQLQSIPESRIYLLYGLIGLLALIALFLMWKGCKILWNIFKGYGVPNVTSPDLVQHKLGEVIKLDENSTFFDLGAGEGHIVNHIQTLYPDATCIGVEFAPEAFHKAKILKDQTGGTYQLLKQNLFSVDLHPSTHIYCYLMPHLMSKVWKKIKEECSLGTYLYVNAFPIKDIDPLETIVIEKGEKFSKILYVYQV